MRVDRREDWIAGLVGLGDTREALRFEERRFGYGELGAAAKATAECLVALAIEPGDLVAILAPPSVDGIVLIHAMLAQGVVMMPLNARLTEAEQRDAITTTGARYLVVPRADTQGPQSKGHRLVEGSGCGLVAMDAGRDSIAADLEIRVAASTEDDEAALARRARRVEEGAALVLQTSGTSGRPKAAVLGFDHLMASAFASAALLGSDAGDRWLLCMPIYHIGGLSILVRSALAGASVVLQERFEVGSVVRALENEGITRVSLVATMLERLLEARSGQRAPESLSLVLLGGGPASEDLLERAHGLGYPIAPTYGLTEAASQVATRPPSREVLAGEDLSGGLEALPGVQIRVVDATGVIVAPGIEGEIEISGPIVMRGYLDDPQATREAIREGWLATGDIGRLDARGRLRVLDRRADLILSGGENIYPAEIESMLLEAEGVADVGVFGVPDSEWGARPVAVVVMREGALFDPVLLASFCRSRMASYKRPVEFDVVEELPRTATEKLLRRALRDRWKQNH